MPRPEEMSVDRRSFGGVQGSYGLLPMVLTPWTRQREPTPLPLDGEHVWLGTPVNTPAGVVTIAWRHDPRGYDAVVITDFTEFGKDLPWPRIWPRPE